MQRRYVSIWFRYLLADWQVIRRPELKDVPFVFAAPVHNRLLISAISPLAQLQGIRIGMRAADAKAICPGLEILEDKPDRSGTLLKKLGEWCVRYSPSVMVDDFSTDGLIMDVSGCTHLWGGEPEYLKEIVSRLKGKGYMVQVAIADTIGASWAISRFDTEMPVVPNGCNTDALLLLPPRALRLDEKTLSKLSKLGFNEIRNFIGMPRSVLRRRFGEDFLTRLGQALGTVDEIMRPLQIPVLFQERLPCLEPIKTRKGIETAILRLLENLCDHLQKEGKGLRTGILSCYRIDGKTVQIDIGTNSPSNSADHLFKLFQLKIEKIRPGWGIELFVLDAPKTDDILPGQKVLWTKKPEMDDQSVIQLLDRVAGKMGSGAIRRYLPSAHYWPERSFKECTVITEKKIMDWPIEKPRPTELLKIPEQIEVMALFPDNPPKFFIYKGKKHVIVKADGPERIEREWWLDTGEHRDYYQVEDKQGQRYWLFRWGHYDDEKQYQWFIHGFFA